MIAERFDLIKVCRWRRSLRKSAYHQTEKCFSTTVQTHDLVSRFNGAPCLLRRVRVFLFQEWSRRANCLFRSTSVRQRSSFDHPDTALSKSPVILPLPFIRGGTSRTRTLGFRLTIGRWGTHTDKSCCSLRALPLPFRSRETVLSTAGREIWQKRFLSL